MRRMGAAVLLFLAAACASADLVLDNGLLHVVFDEQNGKLLSFRDVRNTHEFVGGTPTDGVWQIDLLSQSEDKGLQPLVPIEAKAVRPSDAHEFHGRRVENRENELELVWRQAPGMRVAVNVSLVKDEPTSLWQITIDGLKSAAVHFPRILPIVEQKDEVLAAPYWMGQKTSRARELASNVRIEWTYPGLLSMQCLAFYRANGPGLYLMCDDTAALAKRFAMFGEKGRNVGLELTQLPQGGERYQSPYHAVLGTFEGDWFTVAERYRQWALQQTWAQQSRLKTGGTADWVAQTGLWIWNRGRSDGVLDPAIALQDRAGLPVSVFWHWWHGCAYDTGFPEYLPPREGNESFKAALDRAHAKSIHALVYMNQRLWGMTTRSWTEEGAEKYAVKDADGKVQPEIYNTFTHAPCASMCMGTPFWRNKYAGLAEQAVKELGVDGIYMDQACSSCACFDPTHGHPLGGGAYWMDGFRMLQEDIRERCGAPGPSARKVVLAGEGCGETWLPYLDAMLSLQVSMERYAAPRDWEPIPFFHAVYHGYGIFYGNYSSLTMPPYDDLWPKEFAPKEPLKLLDRKFSKQFRLEQARAFVWGQQPTVANFQPSQFDDRADEIEYVVRLARLRNQALKYFLHGTMLRPPAIDVPDETIDMSRLSIYAGQQEPLKEFKKSYPSVLTSAWRAPDGDVAVAVASISDKPQRFTVREPAEMHVELDAFDARICKFTRQ